MSKEDGQRSAADQEDLRLAKPPVMPLLAPSYKVLVYH